MKTFETEKHNIPEGATHYLEATDSLNFAWWSSRENTLLCPENSGEWQTALSSDNVYNPIPIPQTNIETPEEKVGEWVGGDIATYEGKQALIIAYHPNHPSVVIEMPDNEYLNVLASELSKPETEAERVERERLENGQSLYELVQSLWCTVDSKYTPHPYSSPMVDDKTKEMYARLARAVDYRKESE